MIQKQTVYLPVNGETTQCICNDYPDWMERVEGVTEKEGYFFTPEQLNEYTANVIKQALDTAAENADTRLERGIMGDYYRVVDEQSIIQTFEQTFKQFEV